MRCRACDVETDDFYKSNKSRCRPCLLAQNRTWRAKNRERTNAQALDRHRFKRYGLRPGDLEMMLGRQGGNCQICQKPISLQCRGAHVDHNHETGVVRSLLCKNCNWLIGHSFENPEVLRTAARYLEIFNGP